MATVRLHRQCHWAAVSHVITVNCRFVPRCVLLELNEEVKEEWGMRKSRKNSTRWGMFNRLPWNDPNIDKLYCLGELKANNEMAKERKLMEAQTSMRPWGSNLRVGEIVPNEMGSFDYESSLLVLWYK